MGVPTFKFKLWAFAIGAAVGGSPASLFAGRAGLHQPDHFACAVDPVPGRGGARRRRQHRAASILGAVLIVLPAGANPRTHRRAPRSSCSASCSSS